MFATSSHCQLVVVVEDLKVDIRALAVSLTTYPSIDLMMVTELVSCLVVFLNLSLYSVEPSNLLIKYLDSTLNLVIICVPLVSALRLLYLLPDSLLEHVYPVTYHSVYLDTSNFIVDFVLRSVLHSVDIQLIDVSSTHYPNSWAK